MTFHSFEDVDAWVSGKGPNGAEELRARVETGKVAGIRLVLAEAWLARYDRRRTGEAQSKEQELIERQAIAAEISAQVAQRALRWSILSVVVAAAALFGSAWPYIKDAGRPTASAKP